MGLSVLPARLEKELPIVKEAVLSNTELPLELDIYNDWLLELKTKYNGENIDTFINNQVTNVFMRCIENAGVFKQTEEGKKAFTQFMEELKDVLDK